MCLGGKKMRIEHIGMCVSNPIDMGNWYKDNLGFSVLRSAGSNIQGAMFLVDDSGETVLEIAKLKDEPTLDFNTIQPIQFHIAIDCDDP
jgi:hypothetical protein